MSKSFRDLVVFQRALDLMVEVYATTATFPKHELYGFTSQLRRASLSVVSQIAEGHGRLTYGEWRQFLSQARGSLFEVEAQTIAARRLGFMTEADEGNVIRMVQQVGKALVGLIRWVQRTEEPRNRATPKPRNPAKHMTNVTLAPSLARE